MNRANPGHSRMALATFWRVLDDKLKGSTGDPAYVGYWSKCRKSQLSIAEEVFYLMRLLKSLICGWVVS